MANGANELGRRLDAALDREVAERAAPRSDEYSDLMMDRLPAGFLTSPFQKFWQTVNAILKSRGQPEMLFGEARDWWKEHQEKF